MTDQSVTSVSLSPENREWLRQNTNNMSGFIDDLVEKARKGEGEAEDAVAKYRLEQLEMEKTSLELQLETTNKQIERVEERLEEREEEWEDTLQDAIDTLGKIPDHRLGVDNPGVQTWSDKLDMTPEELLEEYRNA